MSVKKKRKVIKHQHQGKKRHTGSSLLSRHPHLFLATGAMLIIIAVMLLTIGYVSDARVGLSMIAMFFGVALLIFANSVLPKR